MTPPKQREIVLTNKKAIDDLCTAIAKLKNKKDVRELLNDLLSSSETKDIARRYLAAKLLYKRKTYQEVEEKLSMSPLTINKIHFKTKGSKILPNIFK